MSNASAIRSMPSSILTVSVTNGEEFAPPDSGPGSRGALTALVLKLALFSGPSCSANAALLYWETSTLRLIILGWSHRQGLAQNFLGKDGLP